MTITPLEIQKKKFNRTFRGFDETEVEKFLEEISSYLTTLIKERNENRDQIRSLEIRTQELIDREKTVNETLSVVRKVSEDMKENAKKRGETIIAEARHSARQVLSKMQAETKDLKEEIDQLKYRREDIRTSLIGYLKNQISFIENHKINSSANQDSSSEPLEPNSGDVVNKFASSVLDDIPIDARRNRDFSIKSEVSN